MKLSSDQRIAVDMLNQWYRDNRRRTGFNATKMDEINMAVVKGLAGTGKSTIVDTFCADNQIGKDEILTLASSGMAVKNIRDKTGTKNALTIASFLKAPKTIFKICTIGQKSNKATKTFYLNHTGQASELGAIFDEYLSMIESQKLTSSIKQFNLLKTVVMQAKNDYLALIMNKEIPESALLDVTWFNDRITPVFANSTTVPKILQDVKYSFKDSIYTGSFDIEKQTDSHISLIVVDELGMVSQQDIDMLIRVAYQSKISILGLGDENQLLPVKKDKFNWQLLQPRGEHEHTTSYGAVKIYTAVLKQIHRQSSDSFLNVLAKNLANKTATIPKAWQQTVEYANYVHEPIKDIHPWSFRFQTPDQIKSVITNADAILTFRNADVRSLTHLKRRFLFNSDNPPVAPQVNELIIITQNENGNQSPDGFKNGERFTITKIYKPKEIFEMTRSADNDNNIYKPFVYAYNDVKDALILVDLSDGDTTYEKIWLNIDDFSNPSINHQSHANYSHGDLIKRCSDFSKRFLHGHELNPYKYMNEDHKDIHYATFGYVTTVHKAQGLEFNNVVYYEAYKNLGNTSFIPQGLRYTAVTRAKKQLVILTD